MKPARNAHPRWEAFVQPPVGSRLAEIVSRLEGVAETSPGLDHPRLLYPIVLSTLRQNGLPPGDPPEWARGLIADRLKSTSQTMRMHAASAPPPADGFNTLAAAVCLAAWLSVGAENPTLSQDHQFIAVAEMLGPGVGAGEVERVIRELLRCLSRIDPNSATYAAFLAATSVCRDYLGEPQVTLRMTKDEYPAVAGVLDELRLGKPHST